MNLCKLNKKFEAKRINELKNEIENLEQKRDSKWFFFFKKLINKKLNKLRKDLNTELHFFIAH
ncbi:MAG: hypothetical protein CMF60_08775 [Magnetococcales bacterium]|nr:hypothetical protein [Magnetococcales bacterium]